MSKIEPKSPPRRSLSVSSPRFAGVASGVEMLTLPAKKIELISMFWSTTFVLGPPFSQATCTEPSPFRSTPSFTWSARNSSRPLACAWSMLPLGQLTLESVTRAPTWSSLSSAVLPGVPPSVTK